MASQTYQLIMRTGPNPGKVFELSQDEITIGRDIGNNVVVNDPEVSRRHTRLRSQAGGYVIEDLGSTNGTFVNGQRLMGPHMLKSGEQVMLGDRVAFSYEAMQFDPNATLVSGAQAAPAAPQETYKVTPPAEYVPPTEPTPSAAEVPPAYSGQVPPGPEPYAPADEPYTPTYEYEEEPERSRTWMYIVGGCVLLFVCVCLGGFAVFDTMDLYCTGTFEGITEAFGFVCP